MFGIYNFNPEPTSNLYPPPHAPPRITVIPFSAVNTSDGNSPSIMWLYRITCCVRRAWGHNTQTRDPPLSIICIIIRKFIINILPPPPRYQYIEQCHQTLNINSPNHLPYNFVHTALILYHDMTLYVLHVPPPNQKSPPPPWNYLICAHGLTLPFQIIYSNDIKNKVISGRSLLFRYLPSASLWFEKVQKISIVFEVLSKNSVFFRTEVKPYTSLPHPG